MNTFTMKELEKSVISFGEDKSAGAFVNYLKEPRYDLVTCGKCGKVQRVKLIQKDNEWIKNYVCASCVLDI